MQYYAPAHAHIHTVFLDMKMNIVTFDPFTLIKADFPLSLGRM